MAPNEKRLLYLLSVIVIICGCGLFFFIRTYDGNIGRDAVEKNIKKTENDIRNLYLEKIDPKELPKKIEELDKILAKEKTKTYTAGEIDISGFGIKVKNMMKEYNLIEQSFKTVNTNNIISLQFQLFGHAYDFMNFLKAVSMNDKYWKIEELFIKSPKSDSTVDVTMRISYETVNTSNR
jgi:hypothetical protein